MICDDIFLASDFLGDWVLLAHIHIENLLSSDDLFLFKDKEAYLFVCLFCAVLINWCSPILNYFYYHGVHKKSFIFQYIFYLRD